MRLLCFWPFFVSSLCLATCPTDEICEPQFQKCYKFMVEEKDFFSAENACQFEGGHLTSFMNAFEKGMIEDVAESMFVGSSDYWIGANKFTSDSWSWTDGSKWDYTSWFPGEPGSGSVASAEIGSGMWMASSENSHKPFICGLPYTGKNLTVPTTPMTTEAPRALCEDGWVHFSQTKSCYKIVFNQNFPAAEKNCISLGAHLASVHSKAENDFIADIAKCGMMMENWFSQTWLGLYKVSGIWYWTDSTPVDYTHWAVGEPNDQFIDGSHTENCMQLYSDPMTVGYANENDYVWMWNDLPCDKIMRTAMCKKPAM